MMSQSKRNRENDAIAVALCLSGDAQGLIREFETVLKSIFHNAPIRHALEIYIVADEAAAREVKNLINKLQIDSRPWRTSVHLRILNIEALISSWRDRLLALVPRIDEGHTFGAFYRIFLGDILGKRTRHVIYTDPDVVFLASLSGLWLQRRDDVMLCWGESACSGVMLIDLKILDMELWSLAANCINIDKSYNDQQLLRAIQAVYPTKFGLLTSAWDIHLADGCWRYRDALPENRPEAGFLHFNGGGHSKQAFFELDKTWAYQTRGWKMASFYIELPWSWLFYRGEVDAEEAGGASFVTVSYEAL